MTVTPPSSTDPIDIDSPAVGMDEVVPRPRRERLPLRVRAYTASDWRAVEALVVAQLEQEFIALRLEDRQLLSELEHDYGRETLLVAVSEEEQNAGVIGVIALKAEGPRIGRIQALTVSPDERRRGAGTALLRAALADAAARGLDDLVVDAPRRDSGGSAGFLRATGFHLMAVTLHTSIYSRGVEDPVTSH